MVLNGRITSVLSPASQLRLLDRGAGM